MRLAAAAVALAAAAVTVVEGKGAMRAGGSGLRQYASAPGYPFGGVGAMYYLGSRQFTRHAVYDEANYTEYVASRDPVWRKKHRARSDTHCEDARGRKPQLDATKSWLMVHIVMDRAPEDVSNVEVEVDVYEELSFRSPCHPPTQVAAVAICSYARPIHPDKQIVDNDFRDPTVCNLHADLDSAHAAARRRLLDTSPARYTVVEVAVGAHDLYHAHHLSAAVVELTQDDSSPSKKHYAMLPLSDSGIFLSDNAAAARPHATLFIFAACTMLLSLQ